MSAGARPPEPPADWHTRASEDVARRLGTNANTGLSSLDAEARLQHFGSNEIGGGRTRSPLLMLIGQFTDFMIVVLILAALISALLGDVVDTLAILTIIALNAVIGFTQQYRAERAIAALKQMAAPHAHVVRDGHPQLLSAGTLVPGDIVVLEAGQAVPADLRLVQVAELKIDEAALTGESAAVEKTAATLETTEVPLGDRRNMAYKGTLVTYGRGRGIVIATGAQTELGNIAELLRSQEEGWTPLQKRLARFGRSLASAVVVICALFFVTGLLRGESPMLMLLTAISLAVAAIPEALPAVVSVSLALGARKMAARKALIRRLPAVEALGSVTVICSDKTGTLTENRMRVEEAFAAGASVSDIGPDAVRAEPWRTLFEALALSNDATRDADGQTLGDPTEVALLKAAHAAGLDKAALEAEMPRVGELPFDADRARMTTLHRSGAQVVAFTKGAPEGLLRLCDDALGAGGTVAIDRPAYEEAATRMAAQGLRVLAIAERRWPSAPAPPTPDRVEAGLTLLGLVGMLDPPRPEALEAVQLCKTAGITPVMITGDHAETARAIARRLGIIDGGGRVLTGSELARMSRHELLEHIGHVRVYARVAPEQKLAIVTGLKDRGELVAMTGDGVNDAPALKRADIGVAMGIAGTDVAKEAGDMILLDDNFATIVAAVREGRRIFDNIRKFVKYTLTSNSGEIWTIFLAPFLGLPIPLLPIHILWINLVTDGLPGLALAAEKAERNIMRRRPRPPSESVFAHGLWQHILWVGMLMGAASLFTQSFALATGHSHWQTMVFTVLTLSQLGHALAVRSERESLFTQGLRSNLPLLGAVALTFCLQMATIYVPALNPIFKTEPLQPSELSFCLAMSALVFVGVELEKWAIRRGWLYAAAPGTPAQFGDSEL